MTDDEKAIHVFNAMSQACRHRVLACECGNRNGNVTILSLTDHYFIERYRLRGGVIREMWRCMKCRRVKEVPGE